MKKIKFTNSQIEIINFVIKSNLDVGAYLDWSNVSKEDKQLYEGVKKHLLAIVFDGNTMLASEENLRALWGILEVHLNHVTRYIAECGDENDAEREKQLTQKTIDIIKLKIGK